MNPRRDPYRMRLVLCCLVTGLMCLAVTPTAVAELNIETTVNPMRGEVGEPVELTLTVTDAPGPVTKPVLPNLKHFRAYSQGHVEETTRSGNRVLTRSVFTYQLIPDMPGIHSIGQIEILIGGRSFKTAVIEIEVNEPGGSSSPMPLAQTSSQVKPVVEPASPLSLPPEYMAGKDVFVKAWVDKQSVYVNEPIYLTYTVYTRVNATFKGFDNDPVFKGFWVEEFPPKSTVRTQEKYLGNYRYLVADVRMLALFPTETGEFEIAPGTLGIEVEKRKGVPTPQFVGWDMFGRARYIQRRSQPDQIEIVPKLMQTETIRVTVTQPPVKGKPASFKGAVGRFDLDATVDRTTLEEGESLTYRLRLTGEGNLNTIDMPVLPVMDYFKAYDSSRTLNLVKDRYIVEGEKITETVITARKAGTFKIPALSFSFFDPGSRRYQEILTPEFQITVTRSQNPSAAAQPADETEKKEVSALGEDIRYIKSSPNFSPLFAGSWSASSRVSWALGMGWVLCFVLWLLTPVLFNLNKWMAGKGGRKERVARKKLREASRYLKPGKEKEFYESVYKALYRYFEERLKLEPGEVSWPVLESKLQGKLDSSSLKELKDLFAQLDFSRFARLTQDIKGMRRDFDAVKEVLTSYEGKKL